MKVFELFMDEELFKTNYQLPDGEPDFEQIDTFCESIFGDDLTSDDGCRIYLFAAREQVCRVAIHLTQDQAEIDELDALNDAFAKQLVTEHHLAAFDSRIFAEINSNEALKNFLLGNASHEQPSFELHPIIAAWLECTSSSSMHRQPGALMPSYRLTDNCVMVNIKMGAVYSSAMN